MDPVPPLHVASVFEDELIVTVEGGEIVTVGEGERRHPLLSFTPIV
jgi:hypothetical protein